MYNIIMFKAKWDRQIKVYIDLKKNTARDIISKTVLKVEIYEKYEISDMLLISQIKIFQNILLYEWMPYEWIW